MTKSLVIELKEAARALVYTLLAFVALTIVVTIIPDEGILTYLIKIFGSMVAIMLLATIALLLLTIIITIGTLISIIGRRRRERGPTQV